MQVINELKNGEFDIHMEYQKGKKKLNNFQFVKQINIVGKLIVKSSQMIVNTK